MQGVYWDVGAIKPDTGEFIETNVIVWENIEDPLVYLNDFQSLIYYIQTRNESISTIFNF